MKIIKSLQEKHLSVRLEGRLDTLSSPKLKQELQFFLGSVDELVFDFSDLEYVTSAGLRVLLALQQDMEDHGSMVLTHVNKAVMEVFDITGFLEILHIREDQ